MPHAALWVVQLNMERLLRSSTRCFNAARGFVGGAACRQLGFILVFQGFNAARGFVGGAAKIGDDMLPDEE